MNHDPRKAADLMNRRQQQQRKADKARHQRARLARQMDNATDPDTLDNLADRLAKIERRG
jgi:predicted  nucleic acid-binding Zn-ribbon protein